MGLINFGAPEKEIEFIKKIWDWIYLLKVVLIKVKRKKMSEKFQRVYPIEK